MVIRCLLLWLAWAQDVPSGDVVRLDFPDSVDLKVVVDYIAATLQLPLIYDDGQLNKKVALRVPGTVNRESLLPVLQSILHSQGLALVQAAAPGWWRIVPAERLAGEAGGFAEALPPPGVRDGDVISFALRLEHADLARVQAALTPLISKPGGNLLPVPEARTLVLTDTVRSVRRAVEVAQLMDIAAPAVVVETIPVVHQDVAELAALVLRLVGERERAAAAIPASGPFSVQPDPLRRGLLVVGLPEQVEQARELVERFDVPIERRTEMYQPRYLTAARLQVLIEGFVGPAGLRITSDVPGNTLLVTGSAGAHRQIDDLLKRFDAQASSAAAPLRFYKLMNRRADDVFATLASLLSPGAEADGGGNNKVQPGKTTGGANAASPRASAQAGNKAEQEGRPARPGGESIGAADPLAGQTSSDQPRVLAVQGSNFSLSLDEHTNSIIVLGPPELHQQIEQLIQQLDRRRPQVLVEVTLVSVTVEEGLSLGVELQALDLGNPWDYLLFTSFGLSSIDPTTGQRRLTAMPGGTGVLLAPDEVPIILQALQTSGRTRVFAAPRILVDDNATGTIESVAESPFTSVNAGDTVATTSFAGFAKAGTQLSIEPHIAEGDHLELRYTLTVSSFTGSGSAAAPPPRSSDTITSTVRLPDAYTVVVGGLQTETLGESRSQVPLAGDLPLVGWLFGSRSESRSKVRLYAFIRPMVLRNESFEDLKYLSADDLKAADVDDGFPPTHFQYMR